MTSSIFENAIVQRDKITNKELKTISKYYDSWSKDVNKYFKDISKNIKDTQRLKQTKYEYKMIRRELEAFSKELQGKTEKTIIDKMKELSSNVLKVGSQFLQEIGLLKNTNNVTQEYLRTSFEVVNRILTGKVYKEGFNLSKSIWGSQQKIHNNIYKLIAEGVAKNMTTEQIAKNIQNYINPNKSFLVRLKNGLFITNEQLEYNSKRLVKTLNQHTYQQTLVDFASHNPFIHKFLWIAEGTHPCDLCEERDGQEYTINDLPLDHPNGQCEVELIVDDNMEYRLASWTRGENDLEIDKYIEYITKDKEKEIKRNVENKIFY